MNSEYSPCDDGAMKCCHEMLPSKRLPMLIGYDIIPIICGTVYPMSWNFQPAIFIGHVFQAITIVCNLRITLSKEVALAEFSEPRPPSSHLYVGL